ncbi:MAG: hypothetical protein NVSMB65_15940 [Chloroflexota bacterium]
MPLYDYACGACAHRFEVRQSITADPLTDCPVCHGRIKRVIHASGIVFKGSGFYKTDSRATTKEATPAGAAAGDGKAATVGPEVKPATESTTAAPTDSSTTKAAAASSTSPSTPTT